MSLTVHPEQENANPDDKNEEQEDKPIEIKPWVQYFYPEVVTRLLNKKWIMFALIVGFYYIIQFICCVCACNFYSDHDRFNNCTREDGSVIAGEDASKVYDMALYLLGIFHVMEWIRTTILLTVICIGANLMIAWYLSGLSALYGIAVFIYAHVIYASDDSVACSSV